MPRLPKFFWVIASASTCVVAGVLLVHAQNMPPDTPIRIAHPTIDKDQARITLPAAFWNEHECDWVETAICGRPSDFLHETIIAVTTTRDLLEESLHTIGCHDADAWVNSVRDFPRIRGDQLLMLVDVTRGEEGGGGKTETYALDELFGFQGWGVPLGPFGWMYKGRPGVGPATTTPFADPLPLQIFGDDRSVILHSDPQAALVFKGTQNVSQSFIDHPLAYDDWIYPVARYGRNTKLLPATVYDSNGTVPVKLIIQKVTEEEYLTGVAKVWHDSTFRKYILDQLPLARQTDQDKAEFWKLRTQLRALAAQSIPATSSPDLTQANEMTGRASVLAAAIDKDYGALDAAWANWTVDHAAFEPADDADLTALKRESQLWREHINLEATRTAQLYVAEAAAFEQRQLERQPASDANSQSLQRLRGQEIEARSAALLADNQHPRAYWAAELAHLDPKADPRQTWIDEVKLRVELTNARFDAATTGGIYGQGLQKSSPDLPATQAAYSRATLHVMLADTQLQMLSVNFELAKREGFSNDPDLPSLRKQKDQLESRLKQLQSTTQPG